MALFRLTLWVLPFRYSLAIAGRAARPLRRSPAHEAVPDLQRALARVGRYVPRATCLPRALGAAVALARAGHASDVVLGTPGERRGQEFSSHAWVEADHGFVLGEAADPHCEVARFSFGRRQDLPA